MVGLFINLQHRLWMNNKKVWFCHNMYSFVVERWMQPNHWMIEQTWPNHRFECASESSKLMNLTCFVCSSNAWELMCCFFFNWIHLSMQHNSFASFTSVKFSYQIFHLYFQCFKIIFSLSFRLLTLHVACQIPIFDTKYYFSWHSTGGDQQTCHSSLYKLIISSFL